jgi:hypothetical protein
MNLFPAASFFDFQIKLLVYVESNNIINGRTGYVKKFRFLKKNILYYMCMSEDQNKLGEADFEEGLRQILSPGPGGGDGTAAGKPFGGQARPRPEDAARKAADRAEAERRTVFWVNLMRPIALLALLACLAAFVLRITAER